MLPVFKVKKTHLTVNSVDDAYKMILTLSMKVAEAINIV
jgi:hypothetical protein